MPRVFISDTVTGGTHGALIKAAILANNPNLVDADITLQLNASINLTDILADLASAFNGGYEVFINSTTEAPNLQSYAQTYWGQGQTLRIITPLGALGHVQLYYNPDSRGPQVTCGASEGANNETAYGNALWFFDDDNDALPIDAPSFSTGVIAGKLLYIKDQRECTWWEAIYAAMQTASQGGTPTLNNGYGKINVAAAIAWTGTVPYDPFFPIGTVGTLSATRTLGSIALTGQTVTNATEYTLERNTGSGWEEVVSQASDEFTVSLDHNVVTYFRYKASNPNGDSDYSNIITTLWSENIALVYNDPGANKDMIGVSTGSVPAGAAANSYYTTLTTDEREEIQRQLRDVAGAGNIYTDKISPTDEEAFNTRFLDGNLVVNFCEVTLAEADDAPDSPDGGITSEDDEIQQTRRTNNWVIDLFVGYQYDQEFPSEIKFQDLIDRVEAQFRFLQNLNGAAYKSWPLQRVSAGLWQSVSGHALCHKASWRLRVAQLIQNPN